MVGNQGVEGVGGSEEGTDASSKGVEFVVKVVVLTEKGGELVLEVLVEVDTGIAVVEDRICIRHDGVIGLRVVLALALLDVAVGDITQRPDG